MLRLERPVPPVDFEDQVEKARLAVVEAVTAKTSSLQSVWRRYRIWVRFRQDFAVRQHAKCIYCEGKLTTARGDMDHYRPKSQITLLGSDPDTWGWETVSGEARGRKFQEISASGYWWLAYDWANWVLSCQRCNQEWKKALFPVLPPRPVDSVPPQPGDEASETSLLLNPYDSHDPGEHLSFNRFGEVEGRSLMGKETIKTLGLDRRDLLIRSRREIARVVHQWLLDILTSRRDDIEVQRKALREICKLGQPDEPHAGMVRILFESTTELPWTWLESQVSNWPSVG